LQHVIESILVQLVATYARKHGLRHLCLAGGVALNCVANGAIHERGLFSEIFVQPAAGDAGTSIGAAALANVKSGAGAQLEYANMYLGTAYSSGEIAAILARSKLKYQCLDSAEMSKVIARKLSEGKIGGVFHGRMESGPRALGNRSVIADPSHPGALEAINNIKEREMFRPIAPIVKDEAFDDFFVGKRCKYMLFTCKAKADVAHKISAVVHVDGTSRVQTVDRKTNAVIYSIIEEFEKLTRIPVIVNTSLNFKGQPIIESPIDAIGNFFTSGLDFMMLENFLLEK
jgi:carbamoyltransferase